MDVERRVENHIQYSPLVIVTVLYWRRLTSDFYCVDLYLLCTILSYYHILYPPLFLYSTTSLHHYSTIPQLQTSYFPNLCSSYQTFLLEIWEVLDEPVVTMSQEESVEAPLLDIQVHKLIKLSFFFIFNFQYQIRLNEISPTLIDNCCRCVWLNKELIKLNFEN